MNSNLENNKNNYPQNNYNNNIPKDSPLVEFWKIALIVLISFYLGAIWGERGKNNISENKEAGFVKSITSPFSSGNSGKKADMDVFWKAWESVDDKYIDKEKVNDKKRVYGAVKGMVNSLGDPYSGFMDPEETKEFNIDMEGIFEGIGAELGVKDGILTVIAPIEGAPAEKAGLRTGDKIIKIDGEITAEMTVDDAIKKIRGKRGTEVKLTVFRGKDQEPKEISIIRDKIEVKSVLYEKKDGGVAYFKIKKFAEDTSQEFSRLTAKAISDGAKGIILDLRNNPGGYLNVSVEIASEFVPKGKPVVWEKSSDGKKISYEAQGGDILGSVPVVVLINEGSASASEILAGALRDLKGDVLIGKKSYGKGSVQALEKYSDGSSLRITIAKWLTPSGESIHEVGLKPDIEMEITDEDMENKRDPQLDKALEELKKRMVAKK